MRRKLFVLTVLLIFPSFFLLFISSEETPTQRCARCHSDSDEFREWRTSKHAQSLKTLQEKGVKSYSCYRCHSTRIEIPSDWSGVTEYTPTNDPVSCYSCHKHDSGLPHNLRFSYDELCGRCHVKTCACQGAGVIHQSHTELFYGRGGFGVSDMPSIHSQVMKKGCAECHMNKVEKPSGKTALRKTGGHTFRSGYIVCLRCHKNPQDRATEARNELEKMLKRVKAALDASPNKGSIAWKKAKYNYDFVRAEKSLGIHNFSYSKALLKHSLLLLSEIVWEK